MDGKISNIVFTKNRPLQLEGYLESLYRHFPQELFQTYIIYKKELFAEQYKQVFQKFSNCKVIEEKDFSADFLNVVHEITTEYTLFGVDDVVYFASVDFEAINQIFKRFPEDIFGFSLRFGQNIVSGSDELEEFKISDQSFYRLDWTKGQTPTTRYPFELCATIYKTELVKKIIKSSRLNNPFCEKLFAPGSPMIRNIGKITSPRKILKSFGYFFSPNTLESWNCRWCQNHAEHLPNNIYFQKLCACAVQVNMVNTTTKESFDGQEDLTVETLNEKYKQDYRMDIDAMANSNPTATHCGQELFKISKNT